MKVLHNGQALIVGVEKINLHDFPKLKVIGCNMTSIEHLPLDDCKKKGIKVISLKGETEFLEGITSTAEHTIGLMIALMRNYKGAFVSIYRDRDEFKGHTLKGKMLGIIGYGRIGRQMKGIAIGLGMDIYAVDQRDQYQEILKQSDIVSLHIPLQDNEGFFTKEMFKQMKPTAYFINTSRSNIVEEGALLWALENKEIVGAAVDFVDDSELIEYAYKNDNLILTNHLGGNTFEDREKTEEFIENKVNEYINK